MRLAVVLLLAATGCDLMEGAAPPDGAPADAAPPRDDVVEPVGSAATLDVATWNLEWFPKADRTIERVAELIASLDLDLIVVEEVASVDGWDELVERLPEHSGILSSHRYTTTSYQKIGVLYRDRGAEALTPGEPELLLTDEAWVMPRPALRVPFTDASGLTFEVIGVHLKAGRETSDVERRAASVVLLDAWVRDHLAAGGDDELLLIGDFNETLRTPDSDEVLQPLLDPAQYALRTAQLVIDREASFLPSGVLLDHIISSAGLGDELGDAMAIVPDLPAQVQRYEADISDHLPVVLSLPR